jgi:hypothetical protein
MFEASVGSINGLFGRFTGSGILVVGILAIVFIWEVAIIVSAFVAAMVDDPRRARRRPHR